MGYMVMRSKYDWLRGLYGDDGRKREEGVG